MYKPLPKSGWSLLKSAMRLQLNAQILDQAWSTLLGAACPHVPMQGRQFDKIALGNVLLAVAFDRARNHILYYL